jgi:hypothetical protein
VPDRKFFYDCPAPDAELVRIDQFCGEFEKKVPLFGGIHANLQTAAEIIVYL